MVDGCQDVHGQHREHLVVSLLLIGYWRFQVGLL